VRRLSTDQRGISILKVRVNSVALRCKFGITESRVDKITCDSIRRRPLGATIALASRVRGF